MRGGFAFLLNERPTQVPTFSAPLLVVVEYLNTNTANVHLSVSLKGPPLVYLCESWLVSRPGKVSSVSELLEPPAKTTFKSREKNKPAKCSRPSLTFPIRHVSNTFSRGAFAQSRELICSYCCFTFHRRLQQEPECPQLGAATALQQLMDPADF